MNEFLSTLTPEQAKEIFSAVAILWATAFCLRLIAKFILEF